MSGVFAVLSRSERLLPVDSESILSPQPQPSGPLAASPRSTPPYRALFISKDDEVPSRAKLYEHVSYYWAERQQHQQPQRRWMQAVRSTKVSPRSIPFPHIRTQAASMMPPNTTTSTTTAPATTTTTSNSRNNDNGIPDADAHRIATHCLVCSDDSNAKLSALTHATRILGPYEKLMLPTLLYSPLMRPLLEEAAPTVPRSIQQVLSIATNASIPASEALLYYSLSIAYLDVTASAATQSASSGTDSSNYQAFHQSLQSIVAELTGHHGDGGSTITNNTTTITTSSSNPAVDILKVALQECDERRGMTVTTHNAVGCAAVAYAPRDLLLHATLVSHADYNNYSNAFQNNNRKRGGNSNINNKNNNTADSLTALFEPYQPRTTQRRDHDFGLGPLPTDTTSCFFVPCWRRVLLCGLEDPSSLTRVRENIIAATGQRCAQLACAPPRKKPEEKGKGIKCDGADDEDDEIVLSADPNSSSFMLYGPQSGDWRWNSAIGWHGFEGRLMRCGAWCRAATVDGATVQYTRDFVDPVLVDTPESLSLRLPTTVEELADMVCRLGAPLPRSHVGKASVMLPRASLQFALRVLQVRMADIYTQCQHKGIQQLHVRALAKGVVLTVVQSSGMEAKIGSPAQLVAAAVQRGAAAGGGEGGHHPTAASSRALALQSLSQQALSGGYQDAVLWLQYVFEDSKQDASNVRLVPLYDVSKAAAIAEEASRRVADNTQQGEGNGSGTTAGNSDGNNNSNSSNNVTRPTPRVKALLLRRSEESILLRLLECHLHAAYIIGCGIQQLLLRESDGHPLVQRRCGQVVEFGVKECFTNTAGVAVRRTPQQSVCVGPDAKPISLPDEVVDAARVQYPQVLGMMHHYLSAIESQLQANHATTTRTDTGAAPTTTNSNNNNNTYSDSYCTTLYPSDRAVALYVLRHHPQYYTHIRGCGVADVYVKAVPRKETDNTNHNNNINSNSNSNHTSTGRSLKAVLLVERVCGSSVLVPVSDCYAPSPPHALLPYHVLAGSASSSAASAHHQGGKRTRGW